MKKKLLYLLLSSCLCIYSCKKIKKDDEEPYKGRSYFPVNDGHEVVYDVVHIIKNLSTGLYDTSRYQVKEITNGTYTDADGRETHKVNRYIDNDTTSGFVFYKEYAANLLTSTAHRVEDQIRYIRLYFPQYLNKPWDGHALNTLGGRYYKYTTLHVPLTLGSLSFDSTLTVLQAFDSTQTSFTHYEEKYAAKVGMIYKKNEDVNFDLQDSITYHSKYTETLVSYIK